MVRAPRRDAAFALVVGADPLPSFIGERWADVEVDIGGDSVDVDGKDGEV
jgi:hypothetical protein